MNYYNVWKFIKYIEHLFLREIKYNEHVEPRKGEKIYIKSKNCTWPKKKSKNCIKYRVVKIYKAQFHNKIDGVSIWRVHSNQSWAAAYWEMGHENMFVCLFYLCTSSWLLATIKSNLLAIKANYYILPLFT